MSIATKTGDQGTTALMFGHRVSKTHPRVVACGSVDELNTALGMVRAFVDEQGVKEIIFTVQKDLVILMGELAVLPEDRQRYREKGFREVTVLMVDRLTGLIDDLEQNHQLNFTHWSTPGATWGSAVLEQARTVCRRAERDVVGIREHGEEVNPETLRYLNRLSDLCWLYARFVETQAGV